MASVEELVPRGENVAVRYSDQEWTASLRGQWTQAAPSEMDDRPQVLQSLEYLTPVWTEKTALKHPGCVDD
jgi:hypothetical protein